MSTKKNENTLFQSFKYAFNGISSLFKERNFKIHSIIALLVIIAGFFFRITIAEWILLLLTISSVFVAEALNTCIEKVCDFITPNYHKRIGIIKDIAAGAVLIAVIISVIIGILVFRPYIWAYFNFT